MHPLEGARGITEAERLHLNIQNGVQNAVLVVPLCHRKLVIPAGQIQRGGPAVLVKASGDSSMRGRGNRFMSYY